MFLEQLRHIKNMMELSSRFISLSGLSGISAGICALLGTWLAVQTISGYVHEQNVTAEQLVSKLLLLAGGVFIAALVLAFIFTYLRTKIWRFNVEYNYISPAGEPVNSFNCRWFLCASLDCVERLPVCSIGQSDFLWAGTHQRR